MLIESNNKQQRSSTGMLLECSPRLLKVSERLMSQLSSGAVQPDSQHTGCTMVCAQTSISNDATIASMSCSVYCRILAGLCAHILHEFVVLL